ncbi:hypothetical protein KEM54_006773 [Ascosphaera aggregata]|nr:hypothetical protein KEM54_006773 [Ascosphaera aggregata]
MASPQKATVRPQQPPASPRGAAKKMQRIYKEALELFVTRRLPASLEAINALVLPPSLQPQHQREECMSSGGIHGSGGLPANAAAVSAAPANLRVKIWNLYITLLSAIVDLGTEDGSEEFGEDQWRAMASSVRNGRIWEYVVRAGYQGKEGLVDGDIVFNLATLLLKHSNSQALNQQRLETYLASASQLNYDDDDDNNNNKKSNGSTTGTDTLRDLDTRIRILEIFTLHVLPRNNDWDYAREFIKLSDILDDEKKEQFVYTLDALKEEKDQAALKAKELQRQRDEEMEQQKRREIDAAENASAAVKSPTAKSIPSATASQATETQKDTFGIGDSPPKPKRSKTSPSRPKSSASSPAPIKSAIKASSRSLPPNNDPSASSASTTSSQTQTRPAQTSRALRVLTNLFTALMRHFSKTVSTNPMGFLRFVMVVTGLLMALRRPNVRNKLKSVAGAGWSKIAGTVGMGTKVSYI